MAIEQSTTALIADITPSLHQINYSDKIQEVVEAYHRKAGLMLTPAKYYRALSASRCSWHHRAPWNFPVMPLWGFSPSQHWLRR
ncbi:hypothetical protein OK016_01285 [Vibrio chagasii]|nr:hypothetical protein [Vibrio chagasii]